MAFHFPRDAAHVHGAAQGGPHADRRHHARRRRTIPADCQWAIFLRNHDELTLEMVTDEERDYMYNEYAQDPRMRINVGIRRRLAPLMEKRPAADRADERAADVDARHADHLLRRRDRHGRQRLPRRPERRAHADAVERAIATPASPRRTAPRCTRPSSSIRRTATTRVNVAAQERTPTSLLRWMRRLIVRCARSTRRSAAAPGSRSTPRIAACSCSCAATRTRSSSA